MKVYFATNNAHKVSEIAPYLPGVDLSLPADAGVRFGHEETEPDFHGNALGKARALWRLTGGLVLADDSGLCVDALDGRPGVLSARYGSVPGEPVLGSGEKNRLLLAELGDAADRSCRFVCCLALVYGRDEFVLVQETCEGFVLREPRGEGGFGYDPIVFLPELGKSVAELAAGEKNAVSHRGKALARMARILAEME